MNASELREHAEPLELETPAAGFGDAPAARPPWHGTHHGPTASELVGWASSGGAICATLRASGSRVAPDATQALAAPHIT